MFNKALIHIKCDLMKNPYLSASSIFYFNFYITTFLSRIFQLAYILLPWNTIETSHYHFCVATRKSESRERKKLARKILKK